MRKFLSGLLACIMIICYLVSCDMLDADLNYFESSTINTNQSNNINTDTTTNYSQNTNANENANSAPVSSEVSTDLIKTSLSDLYADLERSNIDPNDHGKYYVSIMIQTIEDKSVTKDFSSANIVVTNGDYDTALKEHRQKVAEYYRSLNEPIAKLLGLTEFNYCSSLFSPYIEVMFDSIDEYAIYEKQILEAINNNSEKLVSADVYIISWMDESDFLE